MAELACALLLIVFGALMARSLTQYGLRSTALRAELAHTRQQLAGQQQRLSEARERQQDVEAAITLLEAEQVSLAEEEERLRSLEELASPRGRREEEANDG